ncbi:hypothetical protein M9434_004090 [Picochlorum sp. BPE23]|nr:hypothetical protein M9434_004090 [Picochlorum sp. BPE23]
MSSSDSTKRATLESGRRKLEEFRRKKEAALAGRKSSISSQSKSVDEKASIEAYEREESLKSQIAELLGSVDDLHRSLQDERYNSSILEETIAELRKEVSEAKSAENQEGLLADLEQAKASLEAERDALLSELENTKEQVSEVEDMKQRMLEMETEIDAVRRAHESDKEVMGTLVAKNEELEAVHDQLALKLRDSDIEFQEEIERLREENESLKSAMASNEVDAGNLQKLEAMLAESSGRLSDLQVENETLQAQVEELSNVQQSYEQARSELSSALEVVSARQHEIDELRAELKEIAETEDHGESLKELQERYDALAAESEEKTAMLVSKEDEIERMVQNAQSASESLATEKESLANELDQVSEEKALLMQKVSELQDKLQGDASLQEAAAEKDGMINRLQTDLDQVMSQLEHVLEEKEVLDNQNKEILELTEIAQSKAEQLEADLVDAGNVAEEAITQREEISLKLQALNENYEALRLQKDGLADENENLRSQVESLESSAPTEKIGELADALEQEKTHRQQLEVEIERLKGLEVTFNTQLEEYETKCESAESKSRELQNMVDSLKTMEAELRQQCAGMEGQIADLTTQLRQNGEDSAYEEEAKRLTQANSVLQTELQTVRNELTNAKSQISELAEVAKQNASNAPARLEQQMAAIREELESTREQLSTEKRRTSQLEDFLARQKKDSEATSAGSGNKKEDDVADMEAAALAGGSAFKPIVGLIRSLPSPFGNNSILTSAALQVDKAVVALDARPQYRALVIVYFFILHFLVLM